MRKGNAEIHNICPFIKTLSLDPQLVFKPFCNLVPAASADIEMLAMQKPQSFREHTVSEKIRDFVTLIHEHARVLA